MKMDFGIRDADKIVMTHTGLIQGKKGKIIHVCFERNIGNKKDFIEIQLPSRKILHSQGFDEGEIAQLKLYLKEQEKNIVKTAKQINRDLIFKL